MALSAHTHTPPHRHRETIVANSQRTHEIQAQKLAAAKERLGVAEQQNDQLKSELKTVRAALHTTEVKCNDEAAEILTLAKKVKRSDDDLAQVRSQLSGSEEQCRQLTQELSRERAKVAMLDDECNDFHTRIKSWEDRLQAAKDHELAQARALEASRTEQEKLQTKFEVADAHAAEQRARLESELASTRA